ncbi:ThiF family adenylyltransferase [Clostridium sp.]|jgi:molybdopterin/thiamine biosynthesis adenylyltransferase|uniref:ThiF family adenylyltransferase n=1 Tax=Clostridium sp. TaxID=1506 RepID=UPI003EE83EAB
MKQKILDILNNNSNITQTQDISFIKIYIDKSYQYIFKFIYTIVDTEIPMVIGIPVNWDRKLLDVYIENYREFKYIPHVGSNGNLCLFDLEGVLIDKNFDGLLNQTLRRIKKTLWDGINELNNEDFIEEFEYYWGRLPNTKVLKSMICTTKDIKLIKYADNLKKVIKKTKNNYIDVLRKKNQYSLVSSDAEKDFSTYKDMNIIKNGIYIYIETREYIYPPKWIEDLNIKYINSLLNHNSLDKNTLIHNINKCKGDLVLIFNIKQPNDCNNMIGVIIKDYSIDKASINIKIQSNVFLIPCSVTRCDKEFLVNRGGAIIGIEKKRILVIGCGSIGGYLVSELVKTGINCIDVVDGDLLKEENIYRHLLGMEYVNEYKSKAIVDYIKKNIPSVNICSYEDNIEDVIEDDSIALSEYDLIVSAVGNHNVNRWINEYVHKNNIETPVVYLWNEVLGIGNHVAFISINNKGCYECFFGKSDEGIYDKTSYCERGQNFTKKIRGCGSAYLPFSSTNSVTTAIAGTEVIKKIFECRIEENFLSSIKGDDYYLRKEGFKTSNRYNVQSKDKQILEGKKFKKEDCCVCGDN